MYYYFLANLCFRQFSLLIIITVITINKKKLPIIGIIRIDTTIQKLTLKIKNAITKLLLINYKNLCLRKIIDLPEITTSFHSKKYFCVH